MRFLLLFLLSINSFALDLNERLTAKIIRAYPEKNIIMLDRGIEDGVIKTEHIKLTSKNGYASRAICLNTTLETSYWKVYRIVNSNKLSLDFSYTMVGINQSQLPNSVRDYQNKDKVYVDSQFTYEELREKQVKNQQKVLAKADLPIKTEGFPGQKRSSLDEKSFYERNFDKRQVRDDFERFEVNAYASPYTIQSRDEQKEIDFGIELKNVGNKYEFSLGYNKYDFKIVDAINKNDVSREQNRFYGIFKVLDLFEDWHYVAYFQKDSGSIGKFSFHENHQSIGLLGLEFEKKYAQRLIRHFSFSYIPTLDTRTDRVYSCLNAVCDPNSTSEVELSNLRHRFEVKLKMKYEKFRFNQRLELSPYQDFETGLRFADNKMIYDLGIDYELNSVLSLGYNFIYSNDVLLQDFFQVEPVNTINRLSLKANYQF